MSRSDKVSYLPAIILSVGLHLILMAMLFWGSNADLFNKKIVPPTGNSINAIVLDVDPVHQYNEKQATKRKQAQEAKAREEAVLAEKIEK